MLTIQSPRSTASRLSSVGIATKSPCGEPWAMTPVRGPICTTSKAASRRIIAWINPGEVSFGFPRLRVRIAAMRRRMFTILSAISLALCLATCFIWGRSYFVADILRHRRAAESFTIDASCGNVEVVRMSDRAPWETIWLMAMGEVSLSPPGFSYDRLPASADDRAWRTDVPAKNWEALGFAYRRSARQSQFMSRQWVVPLWAPMALTIIAPFFLLRRRVSDRRRGRDGCCVNCGYELRATLDQCPKCGMAQPHPASAGSAATQASRLEAEICERVFRPIQKGD